MITATPILDEPLHVGLFDSSAAALAWITSTRTPFIAIVPLRAPHPTDDGVVYGWAVAMTREQALTLPGGVLN